MLKTRAEFSKIAGVTKAAITKACKASLKDAICNGKLDMDSEPIKKYLRKRNIDPSSILSQPASEPIPGKKEKYKNPFGLEVDPKILLNKTIVEICELFGTDDRFLKIVESTKKLTEIEKNRIANAKASGLLVAKDLVKVGIIDPLDSVFATMLTDTVKTMSLRAHTMAKSGSTSDEIKVMMVDQISSVIRPAKSKVKRIFKNA